MIGYDEKRKTYFVQIKTKDKITGKPTFKKKRGFTTKREAKIYEADMLKDVSTTTSLITFREMNEKYCDSKQVSDEQRRKRQVSFEKRFPYYETPIKKITKLQLDEWRTELLKRKDISTRTKNVTIGFVKAIFKYAHDVYDLPDVASFLTSGRYTNEEIMNREKPVWDVEQFNKFLDCVELPLYKIFFETLYWTGMRRGECMALQKKDFDGKGVNIRYSIKHFKNGLKPTKTGQTRYVTFDDTLVKDIGPLMKEEGDFIFGGERSLSISVIQKQFINAKAKAGLHDKVTIHCLRHSHATWLINNGVNIVAVSKRLGHTDINTTLKTYAHLFENTDKQMMNLINEKHTQSNKCASIK